MIPSVPRLLLVAASVLAASATGCSNGPASSPGADASAAAGADATSTPSADAGAQAVPDAGPTASDAGLAADAGAAPKVGLTLLDVERAVEVTPDGRSALLWQQSTGDLLLYDVAGGTSQKLTALDPAGLQNQQPFAVSANLRVAALYGFQPGQPALWSKAAGWVKLGSPFPGCVDSSATPAVVLDLGGAFDLSADGSVAVGLLWKDCNSGQAFRWTDAGGKGEYTLLQKVGAPGFERASVVSADGKVAAGFAPVQGQTYSVDRSPAVWQEDGTGKLLDPANDSEPGEAKAVSADGKIVAGDWARAAGGQDGFVWSQGAGLVRFSPASPKPEFQTVYLNAMSADGARLFGNVSTFDPDLLLSTNEAFVRTEAGGFEALASVATAHGVGLPKRTRLTNVMSVSADGLVILGEATVDPDPADPAGSATTKTFVLVLPSGS